MDQQELVEKGRQLIYQGGDHLEVRKLLKELSGSEEAVNQALILLETDFVKYQLAEQERSKVLTQVAVGGMILLFGIALSFYFRITGSGSHRVAWFLMLAGIWWAYRHYRIYRRPVEDFIPRQEYRRKRRFRK